MFDFKTWWLNIIKLINLNILKFSTLWPKSLELSLKNPNLYVNAPNVDDI